MNKNIVVGLIVAGVLVGAIYLYTKKPKLEKPDTSAIDESKKVSNIQTIINEIIEKKNNQSVSQRSSNQITFALTKKLSVTGTWDKRTKEYYDKYKSIVDSELKKLNN